MIEADIISIMLREVDKITQTGKPPAPGALPKWLTYLDHRVDYSPRVTLTTAAKIQNRVRVFFAAYDHQTQQHTCHIDGVEY